MKKTSYLLTTIISIIFFCGLLSTGFADGGFTPTIPKFKGCKAKCVSPNTQGQKGQQGTNIYKKSKIKNLKSKIISLSPGITEIVYALGAGEKIVAVSDFCTYPPEVKNKPLIGGSINPSFERILVSQPDLIIYQGAFSKIKKFCENYEIPTCNVQLDDLTSITNSIQQIGNKIGSSKQAVKLRNQITDKLDNIKNLSVNNNTIPILVCVGRETGPVSSCTTIGKKSFINEMLIIAGGSNVCEDVIGAYPTISAEVISSRQPAIIFELRPGQKINEEQIIKEWRILNKRSKIVILTNDFLMVPGPRITKIAEEFKKNYRRKN